MDLRRFGAWHDSRLHPLARTAPHSGVLLAAALGLAFTVGCGPESATPATFAQVQAEVFKPSCNFSACHGVSGKAGGLDLVTAPYAALVNRPAVQAGAVSEGLKRVVPGDPESSFLVRKCALPSASDAKYGARMPQTGMPIDPAQLATLKSWISDGAKDN